MKNERCLFCGKLPKDCKCKRSHLNIENKFDIKQTDYFKNKGVDKVKK